MISARRGRWLFDFPGLFASGLAGPTGQNAPTCSQLTGGAVLRRHPDLRQDRRAAPICFTRLPENQLAGSEMPACQLTNCVLETTVIQRQAYIEALGLCFASS
jgi:hypothetical protein